MQEVKRRGNPNWVRKEASIPEETEAQEKLVKVPGTVFWVNEEGYVKISQELVDKLFNR